MNCDSFHKELIHPLSHPGVGVADDDEEEGLAAEAAAVEHLAHVRRRQDLLAAQVVWKRVE